MASRSASRGPARGLLPMSLFFPVIPLLRDGDRTPLARKRHGVPVFSLRNTGAAARPGNAVWAGASALGVDVPAHERHHALEHVAGLREIRRMAGVAVHVDIVERNLAAGLAIIGDEALRLVAVEGRLDVLVVVHEVAAALEPDRRRGEHGLAALEREHRAALGHVGLALPI